MEQANQIPGEDGDRVKIFKFPRIEDNLLCKCGKESWFWGIDGGFCKKHWGESEFMKRPSLKKEQEKAGEFDR